MKTTATLLQEFKLLKEIKKPSTYQQSRMQEIAEEYKELHGCPLCLMTETNYENLKIENRELRDQIADLRFKLSKTALSLE